MKHVMITCYDSTFAQIVADSEAFDSVLVGDSLGMVIQGHDSTVSVTVENVIYHTEAVWRGLAKSKAAQIPLLIADMPAGSYDTPQAAKRNAALLVRAGAQMVKVEGPVLDAIEAIREEGISVCGHIGLTPQTIQEFKLQGKSQADALRLLEEAKSLEKAGVELLVLEMIPAVLAKEITETVKVPTIGIGAGPDCSGQVLVLYDLLGMNPQFNPKFLKKYLNGYDLTLNAIKAYSADVRSQAFPTDGNSFRLKASPKEQSLES